MLIFFSLNEQFRGVPVLYWCPTCGCFLHQSWGSKTCDFPAFCITCYKAFARLMVTEKPVQWWTHKTRWLQGLPLFRKEMSSDTKGMRWTPPKAFSFFTVRGVKMSLASCSFWKSHVIVFLLLTGASSLTSWKNIHQIALSYRLLILKGYKTNLFQQLAFWAYTSCMDKEFKGSVICTLVWSVSFKRYRNLETCQRTCSVVTFPRNLSQPEESCKPTQYFPFHHFFQKKKPKTTTTNGKKTPHQTLLTEYMRCINESRINSNEQRHHNTNWPCAAFMLNHYRSVESHRVAMKLLC